MSDVLAAVTWWEALERAQGDRTPVVDGNPDGNPVPWEQRFAKTVEVIKQDPANRCRWCGRACLRPGDVDQALRCEAANDGRTARGSPCGRMVFM